MATSSIFANFDIKNKTDAENFVEALDKALSYNKENEVVDYNEITNIDEIKALWLKRDK